MNSCRVSGGPQVAQRIITSDRLSGTHRDPAHMGIISAPAALRLHHHQVAVTPSPTGPDPLTRSRRLNDGIFLGLVPDIDPRMHITVSTPVLAGNLSGYRP